MSSGQPLKILFVITQGQWGGAQRYVFDLATNLGNPSQSPLKLRGESKGGYEIAVLIGERNSELEFRLRRAGIPVHFTNRLRRDIHPLHDLLAIFELKRLFQNLRPDIVHLNSSKAGVVGSIAAKFARVPKVIFTAHGFAFLEPQPWIMKQLYYWAERFASLFRDKIICVSEYDRRAAIQNKLCPADKLITVHNGINDNVIATPGGVEGEAIPGLPRRSAPRNDGIVVGTISHLYKTKGLEYLVEAAKDIDADFVVIGEGPERDNLKLQITNYKLQDKIKLLGEKPDAESILSQFDLFVLPSVKEGFPYTILEAMAAGLPIVATNVGGIPEMITPEVGVLVPPKDPRALAAAIKFLIDNPATAARLGQNAHERVKQFPLEKMILKTEKLYFDN